MFSQIESAIKQAAINQQKDHTAVLKPLKSDILVEAKVQKLAEPTDDICLRVIQRHLKQYREAASLYDKLNQPDRAQTKLQDLAVLEALLPPQLSAAELAAVVAEEVESIQDPGSTSLGFLIQQVKNRVGSASTAGEIAREVKKQLGAKSDG